MASFGDLRELLSTFQLSSSSLEFYVCIFHQKFNLCGYFIADFKFKSTEHWSLNLFLRVPFSTATKTLYPYNIEMVRKWIWMISILQQVTVNMRRCKVMGGRSVTFLREWLSLSRSPWHIILGQGKYLTFNVALRSSLICTRTTLEFTIPIVFSHTQVIAISRIPSIRKIWSKKQGLCNGLPYEEKNTTQ